MKPRALRPPHVERLTARVRALDGPLVQLWAWPGAGQQSLLDALTEDARFGQPLSLDDLGDEGTLTRAVDAAFESGARWLVLPAMPTMPAALTGSVVTIARRLTPGQRLVFSAPRRWPPGPLACSYLLPEEFLLDGDELRTLWSGVTGAEPGEDFVDRLLAATDGWYRPLRLAAEAASAAGSVDVDALVTTPAVASFLRYEVLALFSAEERDLLLTLGAGSGLGEELWRGVLDAEEAELRRALVDDWGLVREAAGGLHLPMLMRRFLAGERRARWPVERRTGLARRLAEVEASLGHPVRALEQLAAAGDDAEIDRHVAERWADLFAAVPLGLLARLFEPRPGVADGPRPTALFARLTEALLWRREEPLAALRRPPAGTDPALAAASRVAGDLLAGTAPPADDVAALPAPLRPLAVLSELAAEGAEAGPETAEESSSASVRLVPALARVAAPPPTRQPAAATPLQALFARALLTLLRRRPALAAELGRRQDLPAVWRRWLAGLAPAELASEPSGYAVTLFGPPSVRLRRPSGRALDVEFPLKRAFLAFAYLSTAPGFEAPRDELVEAVWHDEGEEAVVKNFHPTLSYLRRALAGDDGGASPLLHRRGAYRLNPRLAWTVDVVEFERRAEEGRRRLREGQTERALELWQSAWGLYAGPLLAGWDAPWIGERRDGLQRAWLEVLTSIGEVCERLGRLTEAMDAYRAVVIEDPLQERVHLALMRIYSRQKRRDLVRRQYEKLTGVLVEELGVEPLAETTEAYHRLMA
ncbi:MAG TPA: BTAD domain-containing putative transcriptional regulator [Thermoanaerobaculia bacterium]|nr:BTAD domain-containing putative transcriptional regulator [Thermoanaerobaculia bacterium]